MFGTFPNQISGTSQRFGPPALGGVVNTMFLPFAYNTTSIASGATLFVLPYTAEIVGFTLNVVTAFDGTGTNTLDFGITGALTTFGAAFDASITGQASTGFVASAMFTPLTTETPFLVRYNGTSAAAGAGVIAVFYIMRSQA
jgi:hypothetical protein